MDVMYKQEGPGVGSDRRRITEGSEDAVQKGEGGVGGGELEFGSEDGAGDALLGLTRRWADPERL